jgi:hypothetical protein
VNAATAQPYFAPYPGFFAKAVLSDILVLLDDVQFPQQTTWMTRNRFKNDQGMLWMTVPVWRKGLGFQKIREVRIHHEGTWARKHLASLKAAYGRTPFFSEHQGFLEELFSSPGERLLDFNLRIIRYALQALGFSARIVLQSHLGVEAKEPALTVEICRRLGAGFFHAQRPARKFLDAPALREAGVTLKTFRFLPPIYPQLHGSFLANLSLFDLLFSCGPKAGEIILRSTASDA